MHPSSSSAFQRHQEHDLKHPTSVDLITTKQNKTNYLPSYIDLYTIIITLVYKIDRVNKEDVELLV